MSATHFVARMGPVILALQRTLAAVQWQQAGVSTAAFQKVVVHDQPDILQAMAETLLLADRVALIIPDSTRSSSELKGRTLQSVITREIIVIVSDRNYGDRLAANSGSAHQPGSWLLRDLALEALHGPVAGVPHAYVRVTDCEPIRFKGGERDELTGRGAEVMLLEVGCGTLASDLGRSFY